MLYKKAGLDSARVNDRKRRKKEKKKESKKQKRIKISVLN